MHTPKDKYKTNIAITKNRKMAPPVTDSLPSGEGDGEGDGGDGDGVVDDDGDGVGPSGLGHIIDVWAKIMGAFI